MIKRPKIQKKYWVIKNVKRNSIWKEVYFSKEAAEAELAYQIKNLPIGMTGKNWFIDEGTFMGEEDGLEDF